MLETDATKLWRYDPFDSKKVGTVISGLPLLSMQAWRVLIILYGVFCIHRPEGPLPPIHLWLAVPGRRHVLDYLYHVATCIEGVLAKVPPAQVYRIARRPGFIEIA